MITVSPSRMIAFNSRNHPIAPQQFETDKGCLTISEAKPADFHAISRLVWTTERDISESPEEKATLSKRLESLVNYYTGYLKEIYNQQDGNSTILVAKDAAGKVVGSSAMKSAKDVSEVFADGKFVTLDLRGSGDIEHCHILPEYRGQKLGQKLVSLLVDSVKGHYENVFCVANTNAKGFYEKLQFHLMRGKDLFVKLYEDGIYRNYHSLSTRRVTLMGQELTEKGSIENKISTEMKKALSKTL